MVHLNSIKKLVKILVQEKVVQISIQSTTDKSMSEGD